MYGGLDIGEASKVIACEIIPSKLTEGRFQATVMARFNTHKTKWAHVLSFYDDELIFQPTEFIGLTPGEINKLFMERDRKYLNS